MSTILLLIISNVFMTFAWYGHLKWFGHDRTGGTGGSWPIWAIILLSWGIAFFEYCFQVPANRLGRDGGFDTAQLKTIQEVITLSVFVLFSIFFMHEKMKWNYAVGFIFIAIGAAFVFKPWGAGVR
jgi:uncharacterized protein